MRFEAFMAWRYIRASKGFASIVAWFSFSGIALGVATLIVVMSVMNGFRSELLNAVVGMRGHLTIHHQKSFQISDATRVINLLHKDKHVKNALPLLERQAVVIAGGQARGVQVHGIRAEDVKERPTIKLEQGCIFGKDGIWVGSAFAKITGVLIGDSITFMQPIGRLTPFGRVPEQKNFTICGIFSSNMNEFDKNVVLMDLSSAQLFFHQHDRVSQIEVRLDDWRYGSQIAESWNTPPYYAVDWKHSDAAIFRAVEVERNVMFLILTLIILIASFNIVSSLIMLVQQKTRDIAILRSIGASHLSIGRIFLMTGSSIGIVGTFLGVFLGLGFALNIRSIQKWLEAKTGTDLFNAEIYFLTHLPCKVEYPEIAGVILFTLVITVIAAIYPAYRATRMEPADALRY